MRRHNPFKTPAALSAFAKGEMKNFLAAATPGGIEAQEHAGQQELVRSEALPLDMEGTTRAQLEKLGFRFGEPIDDLFVACTLPAGWQKVRTDDSLWSELRDEQGRARADIFYKGAFYDRRAFIAFRSRYSVETTFNPDDEDRFYIARAKDRATNTYLFETQWITRAAYHTTRTNYDLVCRDFLNEHYPRWQDALAYWEEA